MQDQCDGASQSDRAGGPSDLSRSASQPEALIPRAGFDWWRLVPVYWFQNEPTDRVWDAVLNHALDHFQPVPGYMTAEVGPFTVWCANWPYAFGSRYNPQNTGLPMVRTRRRLRAMLYASQRADMTAEVASAMSARSGETEGLAPKAASAVPQGDAQ